MRLVRVDKTGMRATRASQPLVALVFLLTQAHAQIASLGLVKGLTNKVFCKRIVVVSAKQHETYEHFGSPRARRQATFTPRGRYRGQTQSQYLAIDGGNGKDEGKAEAQSAADSSRASVSGNSGMGQAQSQSIYDPSCDDCYGAPRKEDESLRRQHGGSNGYGPGWSTTRPEYSSYYPGQSPDSNSYIHSPDYTAYRPSDKSSLPATDNQGTANGPGGVRNSFGPSYYNYGPQGLESSNPSRTGYEPGKNIKSHGVGPDTSTYGSSLNPSFSGQPDGSTLGGNLHPSSQGGSHNNVPAHDLNGQTISSTPGGGRATPSYRGNYQPTDYISGQTGKDNTPSVNTNDGLFYNPSQRSVPLSTGQRGRDMYVPNGSSLPPGQLNEPYNQKFIPHNAEDVNRFDAQQSPTGIGNYGQNRFPHRSDVLEDKQVNWPPAGPSSRYNIPNDPRQYSSENVRGSRPDGVYQYATGTPGGQYSSGAVEPMHQFSPGSQTETGDPRNSYNPGSGSGSIQRVPGRQYGPNGPDVGLNGIPRNQFIPGNDGYGMGGQYNPRGQYIPEGGPQSRVVGSSRQYIPDNSGSRTGNIGGQYSPASGPVTESGGNYIPERDIDAKGTVAYDPNGQYTPGSGLAPGIGEQYYPGTDLGLGSGGQYSPGRDPVTGAQFIPGRNLATETTKPGGQYTPGNGPAAGTQYIPGRNLDSGTASQFSPVNGPGTNEQYTPERDSWKGSGTGVPMGQNSPGSGSGTVPGGQRIPGRDTGSGIRDPGGQYTPENGPAAGTQYIPGRNLDSGTGSQFSPANVLKPGTNGQYTPGRDTWKGSGTGVPTGQIYPGSGSGLVSGGQQIPGRDIGSGVRDPGGQYTPGSGPGIKSDGQYYPGRDIGTETEGPYLRGPSPGTGSSGQNIPGHIGSGTGEQYSPGRGGDSRGSSYSPGISPSTGSGGQYIPRVSSGSDTGSPYNHGVGVRPGSQYDLSNGAHFGPKGTNNRPDSGIGGVRGQYTPNLTSSGVMPPGGPPFPGDRYGYSNRPDKVGEGQNGPYPGLVGRDAAGQYPNSQTGTQYEAGGSNPTYNGVPQNYVDPQSIADDGDSEAEAVVSQAINGTTASASSKGGNDKARAQTHVQGTYSGGGSFQAQAQIAGENKEAESEVSGGKKGASSSATGSGRNNKSQASVQLGSETGAVQTNSQSSGAMHSSNSQVQGSVKGGTADAQARGPGSTSSQAQIGFTPYKDNEKSKHDLQKSPFVGGGIASAQSSGRTGQSQSQLHGTFKYGITYNGAAQSGASVDKDAIFANRLSFEKVDVFDEKDKNINIDVTEPPPEPEVPETTPDTSPALSQFAEEQQKEIETTTTEISLEETIKDLETKYDSHPHADHHAHVTTPSASTLTDNRRSFHNYYGNEYDSYTTDKDENDDYDPEGAEVDQGAEYANYDEYRGDATHQSLQSPPKGLEVHQSTGGNTQHILLGKLKKQDAEITQKSSEMPDEKRIYQPGEHVPGTGGYTIPIGFTGSVKSVASKEKTYVVGSKDSPSQAQTVTLTPGSGAVRYSRPTGYGKYVRPTNLRSLTDNRDSDRYVSVSKSVTRDLDDDNNIRKQYSHTYYTKSSSCGYFTFTCTMVSGAEGKKKVCRPKIPTNPDGTPMRC